MRQKYLMTVNANSQLAQQDETQKANRTYSSPPQATREAEAYSLVAYNAILKYY